jgi:transcriptional regulator with XRE-family HTH domain
MGIEGIIEEIRLRGLTGYKIAEDTGLSQVGIDKILNGTKYQSFNIRNC